MWFAIKELINVLGLTF